MPVKKFKDPFNQPVAKPVTKILEASESDAATKELPLKRTRNVDSILERMPTSSEPTKKYSKEDLKLGWGNASGRVLKYLLEGERLEDLMKETKLKDLGVFLGIATEKVLLLEGQPTQIISQPQHQAIDQLGIALKNALEKRGLVTLTERTVKIEPKVNDISNG